VGVFAESRVRLGSEANVELVRTNVGFVPESDRARLPANAHAGLAVGVVAEGNVELGEDACVG
jgi:hypothetical protein